MTNHTPDPIRQLQQALKSGAIDQATFDFAVANITGNTGSGSIAQSGGVASGQGGIAVGGDIQGDVYVGQLPSDDTEALNIYRRVLVANCRRLPLRGVDVGASDPTGQKQIDLDQVYIELDTTTTERALSDHELDEPDTKQQERLLRVDQQDEETETLTALHMALRHQRLVLLGGPGSGKSTFLNHMGLCLALNALEPDEAWLTRLRGWPDEQITPLPLTVILRDFAAHNINTNEPAELAHLWTFIQQQLQSQNLDFVQEPLLKALEQGQVLLLFDGLDEIPTTRQRTFVRDSVAAFVGRYPACCAIVTCRTLSYQDEAWRLHDFQPTTLAPFNETQINNFIAAWYGELQRLTIITQREATTLTTHLQEALERSDLRDLAETPLLLTVMALVHTHEGRLPDARALLYEKTIDILLYRWEEIKLGKEKDAPTLRRILREAGRENIDLKRILAQLAFEAHQQVAPAEGDGENRTLADIGELRLQKALASLHPEKSLDWAHQLIQAIKMRAGLLMERTNEQYTFPHRTFQEYLAGAHLASSPDFVKQTYALTEQASFWWQAVLLGVGRLVYVIEEPERPLPLVAELTGLGAEGPPNDADEATIYWKRRWLAGAILLEIGLNRVQDSVLGQLLLEQCRKNMVGLLNADALTAVERNQAADETLVRLGDPRLEVLTLEQMQFCYVPAGAFELGEGDEQYTHELDYSYWISRFPITNAQFQHFVDADGYANPSYWHEAATDGFWKDGKFKGRYEKDFTDGPRLLSRPFHYANHPAVGVSWYGALAFCRWLTEKMHAAGNLPPDWQVTLPNEPEWEKAARGGRQILAQPQISPLLSGAFSPALKEAIDGEVVDNPLPRRRYPWGDELTTEHCNFTETEINTTSAVGCFGRGNSPYGVEEMSGNVLEWSLSERKAYPYAPDDGREDLTTGGDTWRVLRGGAFDHYDNDVRCAARFDLQPNLRGYGVGFRCVVSPFGSGPSVAHA